MIETPKKPSPPLSEEEIARRLIEQIVKDLSQAGPITIAPPFDPKTAPPDDKATVGLLLASFLRDRDVPLETPVTQARDTLDTLKYLAVPAAILGGVPLARLAQTGEAFPKYKRTDRVWEPTTFAQDATRQLVGSALAPVTHLPMLALSNAAEALAAHAALTSRFRGQPSAWAEWSLPAVAATAALARYALSAAAIEPLTRALLMGQAYPVYRTRKGKDVQQSVLADLLYGGLVGAVPAASRALAARAWADRGQALVEQIPS